MTEETPKAAPAAIPPSPNPHLAEQMASAAMSGDPDKALDALAAAGVIPQDTAEKMRAESKREQMMMAQFANQIAQNTEGVRLMAHAMDSWRDGVRSDMAGLARDIDLIRRALKRVPAFADELDKLEIDRQNRAEVAAKVKAGSAGSKQVTTPKP